MDKQRDWSLKVAIALPILMRSRHLKLHDASRRTAIFKHLTTIPQVFTLFLLGTLTGCYHFAKVEPISGKIVDARTRQPIGGIPLTRLVETDVAASCMPTAGISQTPSRYLNFISDRNGSFEMHGFQFPLHLCTSYKNQILYVNFDEQGIDMPSSRLLIPEQFPQQKTPRDPRYFPVTVRFYSTGGPPRKGLDLELFNTSDIEVSLIPVLENPEECSVISDSTDRETCSNLNSYRKAVLNRRQDLCATVRDNDLRMSCKRTTQDTIKEIENGIHSLEKE